MKQKIWGREGGREEWMDRWMDGWRFFCNNGDIRAYLGVKREKQMKSLEKSVKKTKEIGTQNPGILEENEINRT